MKLSRAAYKMARNTLEAYDPVSQGWVTLDFKCQLANSGRWIGRSEDFYNRRVLLTPAPLPDNYEVVRIAGVEAQEYLIFANRPYGQPNYQMDKSYLYEYNVFNCETHHADLVGLTPTLSASGINGKKTETVLGSYPVAVDRYASASNTTVKDIVQSKCNVYIPTYAGANTEHSLHLAGEYFDIKEAYLEMSLTHLNCIKR